jgi:hypothetical protein
MPDSGHDRFGGLTDGVLALVPVRRTRCGETSAFPLDRHRKWIGFR